MNRFSLLFLAVCGLCFSCGSSSPQGGSNVSKESAPSPSPSPASVIDQCHVEQKLKTAAGEIKINELAETEPTQNKHFYEITLNGKSLNKETSYCTLIDKRFDDVGGKEVVLVSQRTYDGSLVDYNGNPIGPDTMYKLLALKPDGSFWLSKSFGNQSPYVEATIETEKLVIKFQDAFLEGPDHYDIGREETWVYQDGKLSKLPKRR